MTPAFTVRTSSHFERLATAQLKKHSESRLCSVEQLGFFKSIHTIRAAITRSRNSPDLKQAAYGAYGLDGGGFVTTSPVKQWN